MTSLQPKTRQTREKAGKASAASSSRVPQSGEATVTSAIAAEPDLAPLKAISRLYPNPPAWRRAILRFKIKEQLEEGRGKKWNWHKGAVHPTNQEPEESEIEGVRQKFGYKREEDGGPSRLFLMMLADAMLPLPRYPMSGVVSPSLLATSGIVPFSIFSTGPDIIQHYYDCIVAAEKEVILLTNYWQLGKNVDRIADALRELNSRHEKRIKARDTSVSRDGASKEKADDATISEKGPQRKIKLEDQIVVKLMWDRGPQTLADLFRVRKPVLPDAWKKNGLPTMDEVPYLTIEILNYHRPLMGTFHAKLLLVDRQVALLNSNNIQDRPNVEACTRLEGDIVNSVYDHALISWGNKLQPPLPCLSQPAPKIPSPASFSSHDESTLPHLTDTKLREMAKLARKRLYDDDKESEGRAQRDGKRLSFAEVVENVIRRDGQSTSTAQNPAPAISAAEKPKEPMTSAERDRAAHRAGAEWARKVLGERFNMKDGQQAPGSITPDRRNLNASGGTPKHLPNGQASSDDEHAHNRRHFADVVHSLMEKEGMKAGLWAEGALDAFGLGPSSSRNVADDARRSRMAAKGAAAKLLKVPHAVQEEGSAETQDGDKTIDEKGAVHDATGNHMNGDTEHDASHDDVERGTAQETFPSTSPSMSTANLDSTTQQGDDADGKSLHSQSASPPTIVTSDTERAPSLERKESAPGSHAYQQRHQRTISTRSKASVSERLAAITKSLDFANLSQVRGEITAEQLAALPNVSTPDVEGTPSFEVLDFEPLVYHSPHEPVPMALVNRRPHGTPGHSDIRNAQDAAWLAGFRYAKKHIFIQSPTLNATPVKHAILHAARRHVRVELWLGLGFNDKSESMPFQGGTNEQVVTRLYRQLRREGKGDEKYLEVYWYTGKDMTRPLNAVRKQRNCHVKYAQFDDQVAIIGSGNQDTQSWYHSQEINVMVDSRQIVGEWNRSLRCNQSTGQYGKVGLDGIWRGQSGSEKVDKGGD